MFLFLSVVSMALAWGIFFLVDSGQESFDNQINDYLNGVIDVDKERIDDFIDEMENDVLFLVESNGAREILKKDLEKSVVATKLGVGDKVKVIAKEINNYLRIHPYMTLSDLQASEEFLSIAVQDIGNNGYSAIVGADDTVTYFHIDSSIIGKKIKDIAIDVRLVEAINEAKATGFGDGLYTWIGADNISREKYLEAGIVGQKTADGVGFISVATVYVDDYLVAKNVSDRINKNFERFKENRGYFHILFVSPDNLIVHMAKPMEGVGVNILFSEIGIADMYSKLDGLKKRDVIFYGPFVGHREMRELQIASASNVYEGDEFLGSIILIKNIGKFGNILEEENSFGKNDEDYLVDKDGLLITPLSTRDVSVLVQEVRTENVEECIKDFGEAERLNMSIEEYYVFEKKERKESILIPFQNFEGDLVYGLYRPIGRVEWCLLSEVSFDEVLSKPMKESFKGQIIFRVWVFLFLIGLVIIASLFIDKRYILKRRKKRVYFFGMCEKIMKKINKLLIFSVGILALVVLVVALENIYGDIFEIVLLISVFILIAVVIGILLYLYSLTKTPKSKR